MILKEIKSFALIGLFLASFISVSAQSTEDIFDIRLSYEFLNPKDISDEFMDHLDDPAALSVPSGDTVIVAVYFTVNDLVGLQGMTFQVMEGSEKRSSEIYYAFEDYISDYESGLYRDNKYFISKLGHYPFSDNMLVKVKLKYTDRETPYYSGSMRQ